MDENNSDIGQVTSGALLKHNSLKSSVLFAYDNKVKQKHNIKKKKLKKTVKFKIKTKLKFPIKNMVKQKIVKIRNADNKKTEFGKVEITTGKGLAVPICEGEEIVSIFKSL